MMKYLPQKAQQYIYRHATVVLWLCYFVIAVFIYCRAANSLLIDDGIAGLVDFEKQGYKGFFSSFNFPSLYYMHDIAMLLVYGIAGKSSIGWFFVMATMHSLNATLAYKLFSVLYSLFGVKHANVVAFAGSSLFLLSPYQTENVLWAATIHYSTSLLFLLLTCLVIVRQLKVGALRFQHITGIALLHMAALTSLEISLVFPAVYIVMGVTVIYWGKTKVSIRQYLAKILLPLAAITLLYFVFTFMLKGMLIPHYGNEHLTNLSYANYIINTAKHTVKLLTYIHFADYHWREVVYVFCERWKVVSLLTLVVLSSGGAIVYYKTSKSGLLVYAMLITCAMIVLFPVLNMYFMYLFTPENDRLTYFYSLFLYQLIAFVLVAVSLRWGMALLFVFGCTGLVFLYEEASKWHEAGKVHASLINSFAWSDANKVYVLNQPNNYKGVYEFRTNRRLARALFFLNDIDMGEKITHVLSSAQVSLRDSTTVSIVNDSTLQVDFISNGGWLMHERVGASDYSTNEYSVKVDPWKPSYQVVFHNKPKDAVYIYPTDNTFKKLEGF